ncbi:PucR family transcriptional regulator ligand-binding domain-containing protein [Hominifimenecus sp. rT4P-3]|uniref:PucR family transcriptional regulator n=1 Tax=Hominifimenecus sp. rT4P-3 TaxID=3242979 RepID=UPI003DA31D36
MKLPSLGQSCITAGHGGIFNNIKKIEVTEEPYPAIRDFLVPGSFFLTTFWSMRNDKENRIQMVREMIECRCAGLGIMPAPNLGGVIDEEILELGNRYEFPIVYIPEGTGWGNIISEYGLLAHNLFSSGTNQQLPDVLNIFTEFQEDENIENFRRKVSGLLQVPLIVSTDTVYSGDLPDVTVAMIMAKVQSVCQENVRSFASPITIRIDDTHSIVVHFGKKALVIAYTVSRLLDSSAFQLFYKIAPAMAKTLDRYCTNPYSIRGKHFTGDLGDKPMYCVLMKKKDFRDIERELGGPYIIYERNDYLNYCIILIPDEVHKTCEVYPVYREMMDKIKPELFVFSQVSMEKRNLISKLESIKYMVSTLAYLEGMYSVDELPLLYLLSYAPLEYRRQLFGETGMRSLQEEDRSFLETLRMYILLRNIVDVGNIQGIHPNSVKYRLKKMLTRFGYREEDVLGDLSYIELLMQLEFMTIEK